MVVTVAATGPGTDAEPVNSTFFASRYVRDPLPRAGRQQFPFQFQYAARRPMVGPARRGFHY
nr:unnamed protein product [Digitaria exilis]